MPTSLPLQNMKLYELQKKASTISALRTDTIILYLHFILFCWTTEIKQKILQWKVFISHYLNGLTFNI